MKSVLFRALTALAIGGLAFSFAAVANATTVKFVSTVALTNSPVNKVTLSSDGLNDTLTVGVPDTISEFIEATVGTGTWLKFGSVAANFTFSVPTPSGTTTDSGTIAGSQTTGDTPNTGNLQISWTDQPTEFDFADGTKLDVTLGDLDESCTGNNCISRGGPYYMSATFLLLNGPTTSSSEAPLPAALPMFTSGLGLVGLLGWRRKRKAGERAN